MTPMWDGTKPHVYFFLLLSKANVNIVNICFSKRAFTIISPFLIKTSNLLLKHDRDYSSRSNMVMSDANLGKLFSREREKLDS